MNSVSDRLRALQKRMKEENLSAWIISSADSHARLGRIKALFSKSQNLSTSLFSEFFTQLVQKSCRHNQL